MTLRRFCCLTVGCVLLAATAVAELPVQPGDLAFGLSMSDTSQTCRQIRAGSSVGAWSAFGYVQSTEFDNYNGILHNAAGNLLALNYGTAAGGALYNLSTSGVDAGQQLFAFDGTLYGLTLTHVGGLSVSPNNQYVACVGTDTGALIVLAYNAGATVGTGAGASITNGWQTATVFPTFTTIGSTWLNNNTILVYAPTATAGQSVLYTVSFDGVTLGTPVAVATITSGNELTSRFTDVEYNPYISPYVFCSFSSRSTVTVNTLTVINPSGWAQVDQADYSTSMQTTREIAFGPDGYLYVAQYARYIDRVDISAVPALPDNVSLDYYQAPAGASYVGIDIAFTTLTGEGACCSPTYVCTIETEVDCTNAGGTWLGDGAPCEAHTCDPIGACCEYIDCSLMNNFDCLAAGGVWQGAGTDCSSNPCMVDMTIAEAKAVGILKNVRLANVTVSCTTDLIASGSSKSLQLQDATGGITVYGTNAELDPILGAAGEGDSITLEGRTGTFNGLFQLNQPFSTPVNHGYVGVPAPTPVTASDFFEGSATAEGYESMLVVVSCVTVDGTGNWAYGTYAATDSTGSFEIRIATNSIDLIGTPIPTGTVDVVGIFSQYDASSPYDGGYQLLVRGIADVTDNPNCGPPTGACCQGASCATMTQADCATAGGYYVGDGSACSPISPCTGACCVAGTCSLQTEDDCLALGGEFVGYGVECLDAICPMAVQPGDIALGLSTWERELTAHQIRGGVKVGSWTSQRYLQSMEFDNSGAAHNAHGNLLALNFGGAGVGGAPTCTDPNRPDEGGKLYNLATNGTNVSEQIWDFNSLTGDSADCTRVTGLSVSPDNQYLACWGTDTQKVYVLGYDAGATPGTGSGASITGEWSYAMSVGGGSHGTAWLDNTHLLVFNASTIPGGATLTELAFVAGSFSVVNSVTVFYPTGSGTAVTDVEYNPAVSPYIFCMCSDFTSSVSSTYLSVINVATFTEYKQISISGSCETGREIALGPDGYLYISQYATGSSTAMTYVDRIDSSTVATWVDDSSVDYYQMPTNGIYSPYNGMDVAFGTNVCRGDTNCDGQIDFGDINPFVDALLNAVYCDGTGANADVSGNGTVGFDDINPFVELLTTNPLPIMCP